MTSTTTLAPGVRVPVDNIEAVARVACRLDAIGERNTRHRVVFGLSWFHIRLLLVVGGARMLEGMSRLLLFYPDWFYDGTSSALRSVRKADYWCAYFVGAIAGALVFGVAADKCGRRPIFFVSLALFVFGLALHGVSWNNTSLTLLRAVSGFGIGGQVPVASTLVLELAPAKTRSRVIVLLEAFWAIGYIIAVELLEFADPTATWHLPFYACLLVVATGGIYFVVPESPKWLASVGRYDEAVAILEQIERSYELAPLEDKAALDDVEAYHVAAPRLSESHIKRAALLFKTPFVRRTIVLSVLYFGFYVAYCIFFLFARVVAYSSAEVVVFSRASVIVLMTSGAIPGCMLAAYVIKWCGLRWTFVVCLLGSSISAIALTTRVGLSQETVIPIGLFLSLFLFGAIGCLSAYAPENYPTAIRGTGAAFPVMFKYVAMLTAPSLWNILTDTRTATFAGLTGWTSSFEFQASNYVTSAMTVLLCIGLLALGFETKGKDVEVFVASKAASAKDEGFYQIATPAVA